MSRQEAKFKIKDSSHQLSLIGNIIRQLLSAKWSYRRSPYSPQEDERIFLSNGLYPAGGLYYDVYAQYYRITQMYDKALIYADSAINLLSGVSDNNGLDYRIKTGRDTC